MTAYFERALLEAVRLGLDDLYATAGRDQTSAEELLRLFVRSQGLEDTAEEDEVVKWLLANRPRLRHGYAREGQHFPAVHLVLQGEQEREQFLGSEGFPDEGGAETYVSMWSKTYGLMIVVPHPDMCVWLYHVVRWAVVTRRRALEAVATLANLSFAGADLSPEVQYLPEHLFARTLSVTASMPEQFIAAPPETLIRAVRGIHVETESTGVKALISVNLTPEDDEE